MLASNRFEVVLSRLGEARSDCLIFIEIIVFIDEYWVSGWRMAQLASGIHR
jgi:hypothetical protein